MLRAAMLTAAAGIPEPPKGQFAVASSSNQQVFWVVPDDVYSICAVAVGAGGGAAYCPGTSTGSGSGGGGGGLSYRNNIPVTPGPCP
jgi:hypothetical protein